MTTEIAGLPFWELTFDADGDPDQADARHVHRRGPEPRDHRSGGVLARLEQ